MSTFRVILLPGVVLPAALAYRALVSALGSGVEVVSKELEVYCTPDPPADYSLDTEVAGMVRESDARGWETFHLVGYSAGGAAALVAAARVPTRLQSLSLLEPAWGGAWSWSPEHRRLWEEYDRLGQLPTEELMPAFMRLQVQPTVDLPPPPVPQPPWMRRRPAAVRAVMSAFATAHVDPDVLAAFRPPVYFALGGLSNPDQFGDIAERLARTFPDFTLEVFANRHHFDPPHRTEPDRLARSLRSLWDRVPG